MAMNMATIWVPKMATTKVNEGRDFQNHVERRVEKMTKWGQDEIWRYMMVLMRPSSWFMGSIPNTFHAMKKWIQEISMRRAPRMNDKVMS